MADTLFHKALKCLSGVKSATHLQRLFRQQSKAKSSKAFRGAKVDITQSYQIMKTISRSVFVTNSCSCCLFNVDIYLKR